MANSIYGYFNRPDDGIPAYDPGFEVPCPICNSPVGRHTAENAIKTISVMVEGDGVSARDIRSYFYRVHAGCYNGLDEEQQAMLDWQIVDARTMATRGNN